MDEDETGGEVVSEWEGYESGPFCFGHWADPGDCDRLCACGHTCALHSGWRWGKCAEEGCECEEYQQTDEQPPREPLTLPTGMIGVPYPTG